MHVFTGVAVRFAKVVIIELGLTSFLPAPIVCFFLMLWVEAARIDRSFLLLLDHRFRYLHVHWASLLFETVGYSLITDECEFDECNFG